MVFAVSLVGLLSASAVALLTGHGDRPEISDGLVVHEWGTFTSVFGSDGSMLTGLEVEEETLPAFVYDLDRMPPTIVKERGAESARSGKPLVILSKGFRRPLENVTVKMETPVLYFYSSTAMDVEVKVGFEGGSISQWFPDRSGGEKTPQATIEEGRTVPRPVDFGGPEPYRGGIEWKARIEAMSGDEDFLAMKNGETTSWLHPREPRSNLLTTEQGEKEKYLFYRGVGNFELPIGFRFRNDRELELSTSMEIPYLLLYRRHGDDVRLLWRGPVHAGGVSRVDLDSDSVPGESGTSAEMRATIYAELKNALSSAGLTSDEAASMLKTWWHSYMDRTGLRAFWVVPREFTDRILPLEIEPMPTRIERVLLGRSEILMPEFERRLVKEFAEKADDEKNNAYRSNRYYEAYKARVAALGQEPQ